jgi:hypothetical protein
VNKNEIKDIWHVLNVEETRTLLALNGLIRLMVKRRGIDIKGIDDESVRVIMEMIEVE